MTAAQAYTASGLPLLQFPDDVVDWAHRYLQVTEVHTDAAK